MSTKTARRAAPEADFKAIYLLSAIDRIEAIKAGLPKSFLEITAQRLGFSKESMNRMLGFSTSTVNRRSEALPPDYSERLLGIAELIGLVEQMVEQSSEPQGFDAASWVANWLHSPLPALGGKMPSDFMDTRVGQEFVADLLRRSQSGAYS